MVTIDDEYLSHYGVARRSGRYPWGSGDNETGPSNTRNKSFLEVADDLKKQGLTDTQIAEGMGMSSTEYRQRRTAEINARKQDQINQAVKLKDLNYSNSAAAREMGIPESTFRTLINPATQEKVAQLETTKNMLKEAVTQSRYVDVGDGVSPHLAVSKTQLGVAVKALEDEGYTVHKVKVDQLGTGLPTEMKVLAPPGVTQREVWENRYNIRLPFQYSEDGGRSFETPQAPLSIDAKRVAIRYKEDGGGAADGVIYVRPGVKDVSIGASNYAQVRIAVNGTHYIKGMALYKDDLPEGVDLVFNTNKSDTGNKFDALKPFGADADNPFGTHIRRQILEDDGKGGKKVSSVMNLVNEEGNWSDWSNNIASQVLAKQSPSLARTQLAMTYERRKSELDEINKLTNPTVRKKLLLEYAQGVDSDAVQLKAAALPRQGWHTILPLERINPSQVYAPNYEDGETVALIRYPHGGKFEIPILTVNNKDREGRSSLGTSPRDAIGIHPSVAERLSGADFDGDTVLVIPNRKGLIKSDPALEGLKNFDPKRDYPSYPGMKVMANTQTEMGKISNLITDMTVRGANSSDIAAAVRHSMVVIDAEKHELNYKQSEIDNNIRALKARYQSDPSRPNSRGASTLLSRANADVFVPKRRDAWVSEGGPINPTTGKRQYTPTGEINKRTGKPKLQKSQKLFEEDDAFELSSGTRIETIYAEHSNRLKDLANQARLSYLGSGSQKYSPSANKVYHKEVQSLEAKLALVIRNRPLERQAQLIGNAAYLQRKAANPQHDKDRLKKIKFEELEKARIRTGAKSNRIVIDDDEWKAIQAGAISENKLSQILDKSDMDRVRDLATPQTNKTMTALKVRRAEQMLELGYTRQQVAKQLGVPLGTLDEGLYGGDE